MLLELVPGVGIEPTLLESKSSALPIELSGNEEKWSGELDLNQQPHASKARILPLNYPPRKIGTLAGIRTRFFAVKVR